MRKKLNDYSELLKIPGYTSVDKLEAISDILKNKKDINTIVEVGAYCGRSAICMANAVSKDVEIFCIDHFYENRVASGPYADGIDGRPLAGQSMNQYEEFIKHTKHYNNIKMISGYFPYDIKWSGENIDVLFIDTDHKNPDDFDILLHMCRFMKKGSIIIGDDHNENYIHGQTTIQNLKILEKVYNTTAKFYGSQNDLYVLEITADYVDISDYGIN